MKIKKYQVVSVVGGLLSYENGFTVSEVEVLGENERRIVLKDESFTRVERKKSICFESIDEPSISLHTNDQCWGSGVRYTLYTFKNKRAATIKKEIEKRIHEKFGYFMQGIDLSMIKDTPSKEGR